MAGKSPTQRSLEYLREQGYHPEVVEKYNSFTRRTNDLWGFVDILAIKRYNFVIKPQSCSFCTGFVCKSTNYCR